MADKEETCHLPVEEWIHSLDFETTDQVKIPSKLADQVIGQDDAIYVIKKAAEQKRHMLLIGEPGTGKSMLANAMVDYLPRGELEDVIAYPNHEDPNEPVVRVVPVGKGKEIVMLGMRIYWLQSTVQGRPASLPAVTESRARNLLQSVRQGFGVFWSSNCPAAGTAYSILLEQADGSRTVLEEGVI